MILFMKWINVLYLLRNNPASYNRQWERSLKYINEHANVFFTTVNAYIWFSYHFIPFMRDISRCAREKLLNVCKCHTWHYFIYWTHNWDDKYTEILFHKRSTICGWVPILCFVGSILQFLHSFMGPELINSSSCPCGAWCRGLTTCPCMSVHLIGKCILNELVGGRVGGGGGGGVGVGGWGGGWGGGGWGVGGWGWGWGGSI